MGRKGALDKGLAEKPPGSGIWWVDIYHQGKRIRERVGGKRDAQGRLFELRVELRDGSRKAKDPVTVATLLREYLPEMLLTNKRPRGEQEVRRYLREFDEEFGKLPALELTVGHIQAWKAKRLAKPSSPATVNRALSALQRVLRLAVRDGDLYRNVAQQAGKVPGERARIRRLTAADKERLRLEMGSHWRLAEFAIETGMRQGAQFGMRREWVDLDARFIILPTRKDPTGRNTAPMTVALSRRAVEILREAMAEQDTPWVFAGPQGRGPIEPRKFCRRVFKPALERAGIPNFRWHDLRHTFGSEKTEAGVDARTLQELGGWKTLAMVGRYSHLEPDRLLEAADRKAPSRVAEPTLKPTEAGMPAEEVP